MTFYSTDPKAIKVYDLLHNFFEQVDWGDKNSDLVFEDGIFIFKDKSLHLQTSSNYMVEIYEALCTHFTPISSWGILSGVRPLKIVHHEKEEGKSQEEIYRNLLYRDKISENKAKLLLEIAGNQEKIYRAQRDHLSLYISLPFCPSICSYCCFHTRSYDKKISRDYVKNLLEDLEDVKEMVKENHRLVDVLYIGGGTPWVLEEEELKKLFLSLEDFKEIKEFTFEGGRVDVLNPEKAKLIASYASRVCLNPQSLTQGITPLLGRPEAKNLSFWMDYFKKQGLIASSDLIAGLPGESLEDFLTSLGELISLEPDNITLHNLSLKKGAELKRVEDSPPVAAMLEEGYQLLKEAGYKPYYIYRQKNMVGRGENVGYEKGNTASLYNIRMMEDAHEILSIGSNAASKKLRGGKTIRIATPKDMFLYMRDKERRKELLKDFFV